VPSIDLDRPRPAWFSRLDAEGSDAAKGGVRMSSSTGPGRPGARGRRVRPEDWPWDYRRAACPLTSSGPPAQRPSANRAGVATCLRIARSCTSAAGSGRQGP